MINLECTKPKCLNYEFATSYKVYEKRKQYNLCKALELYSTSNYSKSQKCDICVYRKEHCQCISKNDYATCTMKMKKCVDYKELSSKYTLDSEFKIIRSFLFINYNLGCYAQC